MGKLHSREKPPEDEEDFDFTNFPSFPPVQPSERQSTSTSDISSPTTLATIGVAFLLANIFLAVSLLPDRPKLENHPMCGITTGGKVRFQKKKNFQRITFVSFQEECYFDCETTYNKRNPSVRLIKDLSCLEDCFPDGLGQRCIGQLIDDVREKGVCDLANSDGADPGSNVYPSNSSCAQYSPNPVVPNIVEGTCSPKTEGNLTSDACRQLVLQQPAVILNTVTELINSACTKNVTDLYLVVEVQYTETTCGCEKPDGTSPLNPDTNPFVATPPPSVVDSPPFPWVRNLDNDNRNPNLRKDKTLPVSLNVNSTKVKLTTKFNFTNTRNRYPWICSLRSKGVSSDHFCAVTLLSVPPKPTVIVGPAHCTFLCKNGKHRIPSCCCRTDTTDCSDDVATCGQSPKVVEMEGEDAVVLCGEWEIGPTPMEISKERYNVALNVLEIIRHPSFDTEKGPIAGSDIAVFKVNDEKIRNDVTKKLKLNPACFSNREFSPSGIQAGWSEPPPFPFLNKFAPAYAGFYRDFFKQWHYRMDIFPECEDPKNSTFGPLLCPSQTPYPPATVCAFDFAKQACFTPGESGSPLMTQDRIKRFYIEGILSFVKGRGCDIFSTNPSAYTKLSCFLPWIAQQYGMDYEKEKETDPKCFQGTPGSISKNETCLQESRLINGKEEKIEKCQNTPSSLQEYLAGEQDCIFPFYYNGRKYNECIVFTEAGYVYPAFRCPVRDIVTKIKGINSFDISAIQDANQTKDCSSFGCQIFQVQKYCPHSTKGFPSNCSDPTSPLDPSITDCTAECRRAAFSTCKNNCPGGEA